MTLSYWHVPPFRQLQIRRIGVKSELDRSSLTFRVRWTGWVLTGVHNRKPSPEV